MVITTKYNIGDKVFIINNNRIIKVPIRNIEAFDDSRVNYILTLRKALTWMDIDRTEIKAESECFKSIEELISYYKEETNDI